jgi:Flp pilus assembly protein TadB
MDSAEIKNFRDDLQRLGEAKVRTDRAVLSTGGEDRRKIVEDWLREQEQERQRREIASLGYGRWTFYIALLTLIAAIVGVVATIFHK